MKKKFVSLFLCVGLIVSLTACGSDKDSDSTSATSEDDVVEITVRSWQYALGNYKGFSDDDELTQAIADEFNATHEGIHATVENMRTEDYNQSLKVDLTSGAGPTVMGIAPGANLEEYKSKMVSLADYAADSWGTDWESQFTEASFATINQSGEDIYAIPSAMSVSGTFWYNSQLMSEAGIEEFPKTWDGLKEAASKLTAANQPGVMFGGSDDWQNYDMFITLLGTLDKDVCNDVFALEDDWTQEAVVKAFEYYNQLFTDGIVQEGSLSTTLYNEGYSQWRDDDGISNVSMIFNGSWDLSSLRTDNSYYDTFSAYGIGAAVMPDIEENKGVVLSTPDVAWGINSNATQEEQDAAWQFIKWLCYDMQQDVVDGLGFFSVLSDAPEPTVTLADDYKNAYEVIAAAAGENAIGFRSSMYTDLNSALFDQLQLLATGQTTPEQAAQAMQSAAEGIN